MKRFVISFIVSLLVLLVVLAANDSQSCEGTINPPCVRSIYLAKFAPSVVVLPTSGPINVPIGMMPYVSWDAINTTLCAQPTAAALTVTLLCTPVSGGATTTVGPFNLAVPTPVVPGPQPFSGPVTVTIPAGTVTSPTICLVQATYSATFSGAGLGGGTISGTGDVEICIVDPAPGSPELPRLGIERLPLFDDDLGYNFCRRGDQAINYFLITNNDPNESVSLSVTSSTKQAAGLPDEFTAEDAPTNLVRAISSPTPGTDAFPTAIITGDDFGLVDFPNPMEVSDRAVSENFIIPPNGAIVIAVAIRSFPMCADGSCAENNVNVVGRYSDGTDALACASTLHVVHSSPAKTVLCEMGDVIQVAPNTDGIFSPAHYFDAEGVDHHAATNWVGNELNFFDVPGRSTWIRGQEFNDPLRPPFAQDYSRGPFEYFNQVSYLVEFFGQVNNFQPVINQVTVTGLDSPHGNEFIVPMIGVNGTDTSPLEINLDLETENLNIRQNEVELFNGAVSDFGQNPPPSLFAEFESFRAFLKTGCEDDAIRSRPELIVFLSPAIRRGTDGGLAKAIDHHIKSDTLMILDKNDAPTEWSATVIGDGVVLPASSGTGELIITYDVEGLPQVPATSRAFIEVTNSGAINSPLRIPVVLRVDTTTVATELVSDDLVQLPAETKLNQNYPNPFNPSTAISYQLSAFSDVELSIYNIAGQLVRTLVQSPQSAGTYSVQWDGRDGFGQMMTSGIYLYRLQTGDAVQTRRLILMK